MAIRSIIVAYSGTASGSGALHLATLMARKYDAHLTGVVSHGPSLMESRYRRYMGQQVLDLLKSRDSATVAEMREAFMAKVNESGPGIRASFLDLDTHSGFSLADCVRTYDIAVMGRRAARAGEEHFGAPPQTIALEGGRPVILVPEGYDLPQINEHALVAWDGQRASARALADAMHILETKARVTILTIGAPVAGGGDSVADYLAHHGITAEHLVQERRSGAVSQSILDTCRSVGAGLLVMGAWGHSPLREALFGGVTVDIMAEAHVPVLMSH
ncbi:universal stress protein [Frigidibacter oleivorans]|uniref:universal stress protein n=1 Tax=Frigidibacter oleivorans TaxID=2487129 RepID=UPI000F8F37E4|nr:universal stress protein [Frigidibacter oleivorans]